MPGSRRVGAGVSTFAPAVHDALTFPYGSPTFTYYFADVGTDAHCHAPGRSGTCRFQIRWRERGSPTGGGDHLDVLGRASGSAVGRQAANEGSRGAVATAHRSRRKVVASDLGARSSGEQDRLGTGGAAAFAPVWSEGGDCQVPSRRVCLSLRDSAAGPEWRRTPVLRTLALGQPLGQLAASGFPDSHACSAVRSGTRKPNAGARSAP